MKRTLTFLIFISLFASISLSQTKHPFSGRLVLSAGGSTVYSLNDYQDTELGFAGNFQAVYHFPWQSDHLLGLRFISSYGFSKNTDPVRISPIKTNLMFVGGGLNYSYNTGGSVIPYLAAGAGFTLFEPLDDNGNNAPNYGTYDRHSFTITGQIGVDVIINKNWSLNFNIQGMGSGSEWLDDWNKGSHDDYYFSGGIGISYALFDAPAAKKPRKDKDSDKDGVPDRLDLCPNTPVGVNVDKNGCPTDMDSDGVPDYQDLCPNTPPNVSVDSDGCPVDTDEDGVADYLDNCPDTPAGTEVDENGCPVEEEEEDQPVVEEEEDTAYNFDTETRIKFYLYTDGNKFCLQTSAFRKKANADKEAQRLIAQNHEAFVHEANIPTKGGKWYQVRVGFYDTKEEAEQYRKDYFSSKNTKSRKDKYLDTKKR